MISTKQMNITPKLKKTQEHKSIEKLKKFHQPKKE